MTVSAGEAAFDGRATSTAAAVAAVRSRNCLRLIVVDGVRMVCSEVGAARIAAPHGCDLCNSMFRTSCTIIVRAQEFVKHLDFLSSVVCGKPTLPSSRKQGEDVIGQD